MDRLDVMVLPERRGFSVDNNAAGWTELIKRLNGSPVAAIGIEPSGGYERGVIRALLEAGLSVRRINPNKLLWRDNLDKNGASIWMRRGGRAD
jgi:transposase